MKKIICILITVLLLMIPVYSSVTQSNVSMVADKQSVNIGDIITLQINNSKMTVSSFTCGIYFNKDMFTVQSISGVNSNGQIIIVEDSSKNNVEALVSSNLSETISFGTVGFAFPNYEEHTYSAGLITEIKFIANKPGIAEFILYEDSDGTNAFISDNISVIECTVDTLNTGDINSDGKVNIIDLIELNRYIEILGNKTPTQADIVKYDFNKDNEINNHDVIALYKYILNLQ